MLNQFVRLETEIRDLENSQVEEKLMLHNIELHNVTAALENKKVEFEEMRKITYVFLLVLPSRFQWMVTGLKFDGVFL